MAVDNPIVHASLTNLKKEVERPDVFRIALSGSKTITFPDLMALESEESEELLRRIEQLRSTWGVLDDWLSEDDAAALRAEKLTHAELLHVVKVASDYYQGFYGKPGEGTASAS